MNQLVDTSSPIDIIMNMEVLAGESSAIFQPNTYDVVDVASFPNSYLQSYKSEQLLRARIKEVIDLINDEVEARENRTITFHIIDAIKVVANIKNKDGQERMALRMIKNLPKDAAPISDHTAICILQLLQL